jgi:hypothetical protein
LRQGATLNNADTRGQEPLPHREPCNEPTTRQREHQRTWTHSSHTTMPGWASGSGAGAAGAQHTAAPQHPQHHTTRRIRPQLPPAPTLRASPSSHVRHNAHKQHTLRHALPRTFPEHVVPDLGVHAGQRHRGRGPRHRVAAQIDVPLCQQARVVLHTEIPRGGGVKPRSSATGRGSHAAQGQGTGSSKCHSLRVSAPQCCAASAAGFFAAPHARECTSVLCCRRRCGCPGCVGKRAQSGGGDACFVQEPPSLLCVPLGDVSRRACEPYSWVARARA